MSARPDDAWVPTVCNMCYQHCPIVVHRVRGVAVKIEGSPTCPGTQGGTCPKGNAGIMKLYDPHRVKRPLKRTNPEKGIGVDPGWVEITWDEAKAILVPRLKRIHETERRKLAVGGFNPDSWSWNVAFAAAFGTPNGGAPNMFSAMGHMCGPGPHGAGLMIHGSENTHPDAEYAKYIMIAGGGAMEAYQSAVAYARLFGDARQRGAKLVVVDPQQSRAAAKADEWVPIRPATDGAFLFGVMYTLIHELSIYDAEYLKRHTNAGYLIGADRYPVRDPESKKPLIWDPVDAIAKPYDDPSIRDYALEGTYATPAGRARPAFGIFKEHILQYTPEWAAQTSGIPAPTIRRLAKEFGEAAQIGSTIVLDGVTYPYRPVSVAGYRGIGAHTNGFHSCWAMEMINMLVGATRAVGGARAWGGWTIPGPDGVVGHHLTGGTYSASAAYPPESITFHEYFPITCTNGLIHYEGQLHPEKYNVMPIDTLIMEYSNPIITGQNPAVVIEGLKKIPFFVDITIYLDETAEFADLILPDTTYLEHWEVVGIPNQAIWSVEDEGPMIQRPVVEPLYDTRPSADIYIQLATELGILTGASGLTAALNGLHGPVYDLGKMYSSVQEYVEDFIGRCNGADQERVWKEGHSLQRIPASKRYLPTCLGGYRLPFYSVELMKTGDGLRSYMEKHNAFQDTVFDERMFFEYAPLPFWHPSVIEEEPAEFDLYVINWKTSLGTVASGTLPATNAWLMELAERDPYATKILLNRETARVKGLRDGEVVWVESPHGKMKGRLKVTETIHPEVIGTIGCFGHYTDHAVGKGRGPGNFNALLGSGLRYMGPSSLQAETAARAKIYAA